MQTIFQTITYINLQSSVARNAAMKAINITDKHGRLPQRFHALTGEQIDVSVQQIAGQLSNGERGCFASHRAVWKQVAQLDGGLHLILEDDIIIQKDLSRLPIIAEHDDTPILVYLGHANFSNNKAQVSGTVLNHIHSDLYQASNCWLTHAYAINPAMARKGLEFTSIMRGSIDQHLVAWQDKHPAYAIIPNAIGQRRVTKQNPSTIRHTIRGHVNIDDLLL